MTQKIKRIYRTIKQPKREINEYQLRYITSSGKKNPFLKGSTISIVKEEIIFAKTNESAKNKARLFIKQAYKKNYVCHPILPILDKLKRDCIASGYELGEKI